VIDDICPDVVPGSCCDLDSSALQVAEEIGAHVAFQEEHMLNLERRERTHRAKKAKASCPPAGPCPGSAGEVTVLKGRGSWVVWRGERLLGRISFPIHWDPPCVAARCHHSGHLPKCSIALPISDENETRLIRWISDQDAHLTKASHMSAAPSDSFM
jgi:hypothetical protein